jgi:hypothetical protein
MTDMKNDHSTQTIQPIHPTHGPFVKEGLMVAFPLCFPGMTDPIPLEESRITALTFGSSGVLFGGTSGKGSHLFAAFFKGSTGAVFDLGRIDGARQCVGIACGKQNLAAAVNGPQGSRILSQKAEGLPDFDLLQEWSFLRRPYEELKWSHRNEQILDLVGLAETPLAIGISEHHLFIVDIDQSRCDIVAEIDSAAHLIVNGNGQVYGLDTGDTLWNFNPSNRQLTRKAIPLPPAAGDKGPLVWTCDAGNAGFYLADPEGKIFLLTPQSQTCRLAAKAPLAPVRCMAVIPDGRVYGFCGESIEHLFVFDPETAVTIDLGVAVSVIQRRRYGYQFSSAVVTQDGHLVFGENDNLGHLWMYFPSIQPKEKRRQASSRDRK